MASSVKKYVSQAFHQSYEPFDRSQQVQTRTELFDEEKVCPYIGKLVHVIDEHAIYVCSSFNDNTGAAVWRPVMADDGTAFFVTTSDGRVLKIGAEFIDGQGRITVTIPSPTVPIINSPA